MVITHMWGIPCEMLEIQIVLRDHPYILLFEDCSHAHGALVDGQPVGTFGDGAAWSLQGQKVVSGGEGGIVLTKHQDFHYRQLIWGHYNKRCSVEIPMDHPLRGYSATGAGLKNRAHPLAVAIALNQLRKLPDFLKTKRKFAARLRAGLGSIAFLEVPDVSSFRNVLIEPAWYAFIIRFKLEKAPCGLTRDVFVKELLERGLVDVDIPHSTRPLHRQPLFTNPASILPHLHPRDDYVDLNVNRTFPLAETFYNEILKLPVWAFEDDRKTADHYIETIVSVSKGWQNSAKL